MLQHLPCKWDWPSAFGKFKEKLQVAGVCGNLLWQSQTPATEQITFVNWMVLAGLKA